VEADEVHLRARNAAVAGLPVDQLAGHAAAELEQDADVAVPVRGDGERAAAPRLADRLRVGGDAVRPGRQLLELRMPGGVGGGDAKEVARQASKRYIGV